MSPKTLKISTPIKVVIPYMNSMNCASPLSTNLHINIVQVQGVNLEWVYKVQLVAAVSWPVHVQCMHLQVTTLRCSKQMLICLSVSINYYSLLLTSFALMGNTMYI